MLGVRKNRKLETRSCKITPAALLLPPAQGKGGQFGTALYCVCPHSMSSHSTCCYHQCKDVIARNRAPGLAWTTQHPSRVHTVTRRTLLSAIIISQCCETVVAHPMSPGCFLHTCPTSPNQHGFGFYERAVCGHRCLTLVWCDAEQPSLCTAVLVKDEAASRYNL